MSEDRETYLDMSIDDEDQLQPGDTLDDGDLEDVLDRGYSPPDRPPKGYEDYPTEAETRQGESLDERLAEEEPDVDPYAVDDRDDDREDENALDEQLGLDEADERTGRLVAPDSGLGEDVDKQSSPATSASTVPAPPPRRRPCTSPASRSRRRTTICERRHRLVRWRVRGRSTPREDLGPRAVEADQVVPAVDDRQRVARRVAVAAEADGDGAVVVAGGGDAVDAVGAALVGLEEAVGVVDRDRPEAVDRDVGADGELVLADGQARARRRRRWPRRRAGRPSRRPCRSGGAPGRRPPCGRSVRSKDVRSAASSSRALRVRSRLAVS